MYITDTDKAKLHGEALQAYREYGRLKSLLRGDRGNADYRYQLKALRSRYQEIKRVLNTDVTPATSENANGGENLDLGELSFEMPEHSAFMKAPPVHDSEPWTNKAKRWGRRVRLSASVAVLLVACVILGLIATKRLNFFGVPTASMQPTLRPRDHLVVYPSSRYVRGDIVVARDPSDPEGYIVKRIVGVGNDNISVYNGRLYVNSEPIHEPYIAETIGYELSSFLVPKDEVFLLGDNRNESDDAHLWLSGLHTDSIVGKVRYVYGPAERRQAPDHHVAAFARVP